MDDAFKLLILMTWANSMLIRVKLNLTPRPWLKLHSFVIVVWAAAECFLVVRVGLSLV